jgi:hypothetical protein
MSKMNPEDTIIDTSTQHEVEDTSGLAEIQHAMDEIEKLKNQENQENEVPIEQEEITKETKEQVETEILEEDTSKKEKKGDKFRKLQNDKYRALAEKEEALQKVAQLEQMLSESLNSGTYHYGKNAYSELDRAKESKKRAIEAGDVDALIESDIALTRALTAVNDLEKWADESKRTEKTTQRQQPAQSYSDLQHEIASDWLDNHNYLQPISKNYDSKLAGQVAEFVNYLDANLAKNNQMNTYLSEDYFNTIEDFISGIKNEPQKETKTQNTNGYVAGVRNSYSSGNGKVSSPTQITLSADEKRMCANAGISEKEWIKYKLEDLKEGKRA